MKPGKPDLTGQQGYAWRLPDSIALRSGKPHAQVAQWVMQAAYAHPIWHSYVLSLVHLRPVSGLRPPLIMVPDATHEFMLYALDPGHPIDFERLRCLQPMNFAAQFKSDDDAAAIRRIEETVQDVIDGVLSPDTDFRWQWYARFGDACSVRRMRTRAH